MVSPPYVDYGRVMCVRILISQLQAVAKTSAAPIERIKVFGLSYRRMTVLLNSVMLAFGSKSGMELNNFQI